MTFDTRENLESRLRTDLIGPLKEDEILIDRPADKYLTGILFPIGRIPDEEDESLGVGEESDIDNTSLPDNGAPLSSSFRPSSMGISFCIAGSKPVIKFELEAAVYKCRWKKELKKGGDGNEGDDPISSDLTDNRGKRSNERWCRKPISATVEVAVDVTTPVEIELEQHGFPENTQLYIQTAGIEGGTGITAVLINRNMEEADRVLNTQRTLFQTAMKIVPCGGTKLIARPHKFGHFRADNSDDEDSGELIYSHVREYAVGHTCAASWAPIHGSPTEVLTEWIPKFTVAATSAEGDEVFDKLRSGGECKPLSAQWLSQAKKVDLIAGLRMLTGCYKKWIDAEQEKVAELSPRFRSTGERHVAQWLQAYSRMEQAITKIDADPSVCLAFQLANLAMQKQREWGNQGASLDWRPFQLGFQLLVLASLIDRDDENHDVMDLLWFPTGGGKTEAYLGLIAFLLFFRRMRAKKTANDDSSQGAGVAVIMRYTLRLLTTQQFERAARLVCACESIRRKMEDELGTSAISIGLWVGSGATSNKISDAHEDTDKSSLQISKCPECDKRVRCPKNTAAYAIYCENDPSKCSLASKKIPLPIWTVDEDIYRELPSLLIGTIDKFAQIVRNENTRRFFGIGTSNSPPELILQDELHLITGPLGTVAGLYEVAIDELCHAAGGRPKVIGSTATIRRAADQVKALFNRKVYQYPAPGLHADNSCFALKDDSRPGRVYLGITSAGRSPKFVLQAISASVLQASNDPAIPTAQLDDYWTLLTYFNSLRELGGAHVLMLDDVTKSIKEYAHRRGEDIRKLGEPVELSSNLNQAEIPVVLDGLGIKRDEGGAFDVALATNMISVGMDIPRLALMIVNGQPKTIAEYIQATSRVGRVHVPGLVITAFNANKPRDRSRYETFCSWHSTLYRDVEATSVTPFAPRAQDKALHGILVALVRHTVQGMSASPSLSASQRKDCAAISKAIADRAKAVDKLDGGSVPRKIEMLLDHWEHRTGIVKYWNDRSYNKYPPLMMSAEAFAALKAVGRERADIWPTMNSMREVEPSCNFKLREFLKVDDTDETQTNDSEGEGES
ncbi:helicase-related protein [Mariniblastus sp.]|nr:helicase-related protein [Mariniblastus sp.]